MSLAIEGGATSVTVAAVAKRAGLSRSSVYEYFSSSADLISDLIMEELDYYCQRLCSAINNVGDPYLHVEIWIAESLRYVADGRHLLVKSLNTVAVPEFRRSEIALGHKKLVATIIEPLKLIGISDIAPALSYLQNTLDAASVRIESGNDSALEIQYAQKYALAGLRALTENVNQSL